MKKVFIAALLLIGTKETFAQINKGQWLVGGTASFEKTKEQGSKQTSIKISPDAGYFFIDNLAGGLRAHFEHNNYTISFATTNFLVAPFVRYYFLSSTQKVNIFADGSYGFGSYHRSGIRQNFNQYTISAGPAIFLTSHTALEFAVQYQSEGGEAYGKNNRTNTFSVNAGFQIHLGNPKK